MTQIEVRSVRQIIEVRGTTPHQVTVQTQPGQSVVVTGSGQRGPQGIQGATGQPGKDGAALIPPILDGGNF